MAEKLTHAVHRTSPKGGPFIGRCVNCGAEELQASAALEECPNTRGATNEQSLLEAITGEVK